MPNYVLNTSPDKYQVIWRSRISTSHTQRPCCTPSLESSTPTGRRLTRLVSSVFLVSSTRSTIKTFW